MISILLAVLFQVVCRWRMEIVNEQYLLAWLKGLKHLFDNPTRENVMHLLETLMDWKCCLYQSCPYEYMFLIGLTVGEPIVFFYKLAGRLDII